MKQIKAFILLSLFLLLSTSTFGQELKKSTDSILVKKTLSKSKFTSRTPAIVEKEKSTSNDELKAVSNSKATKKDYLIKNDSINSRKKIKSNTSLIRNRINNTNDTLSRIKISNNENKSSAIVSDSLKKSIHKKNKS
jgi:hypothetical protein